MNRDQYVKSYITDFRGFQRLCELPEAMAVAMVKESFFYKQFVRGAAREENWCFHNKVGYLLSPTDEEIGKRADETKGEMRIDGTDEWWWRNNDGKELWIYCHDGNYLLYNRKRGEG
jgi:hypothetical protein